jgi:predicted NUDIX family phosphoesterase
MTIDELVYVVPRRAVMGRAGWYGLRTDSREAFIETIGRTGGYRPRPAMERDPDWKQVIPYLVLRDGDDYFLMRRTRAGGDERLHDRFSIGVGGHLNPGDGGLDRGLVREWHEELVADFVPRFELVGLLNDDTTDVGRVHLGVVYQADTAGRSVQVRETAKLTGAFASPADVEVVADELETWSQIVFRALELQAVR